MASRKQRRRRLKEHRHEYEVVYLDDEGNEIDPEPGAEPGDSKRTKTSTRSQSRARGVAQEPSWPRVLKRGAIFAPLFFVMVLLLGGDNASVLGALIQTVLLVSIFVPFSYFMDRIVWRSHLKRQARQASSRKVA